MAGSPSPFFFKICDWASCWAVSIQLIHPFSHSLLVTWQLFRLNDPHMTHACYLLWGDGVASENSRISASVTGQHSEVASLPIFSLHCTHWCTVTSTSNPGQTGFIPAYLKQNRVWDSCLWTRVQFFFLLSCKNNVNWRQCFSKGQVCFVVSEYELYTWDGKGHMDKL